MAVGQAVAGVGGGAAGDQAGRGSVVTARIRKVASGYAVQLGLNPCPPSNVASICVRYSDADNMTDIEVIMQKKGKEHTIKTGACDEKWLRSHMII